MTSDRLASPSSTVEELDEAETPVRTPPARYTRTDSDSGRSRRGETAASGSLRAAQVDETARAAIVLRLRWVRGREQRRAVEDSRGFVANLPKNAADGAIVLGDAFLARGVCRLADARDEGEGAVERADD